MFKLNANRELVRKRGPCGFPDGAAANSVTIVSRRRSRFCGLAKASLSPRNLRNPRAPKFPRTRVGRLSSEQIKFNFLSKTRKTIYRFIYIIPGPVP